ncbi:MAG: DUF5698 domain-containing protein [Anaerolineae bacterium]|nr:DUF5698 domain-containing protein [Anaerolineae bacterium]
MELVITTQTLLSAGLIFVLRVANMSLDTVRVMMVMRGKKLPAWLLGFIQTVIYVAVLTTVITDLSNLLNLIAYAAGFATGNVVGMWVEERLAIGHINLRIISPNLGNAIVEKLREKGYGVTEIPARGMDGAVTLVSASIYRRHVGDVMGIVNSVDPEAFMTAEDMRPVRRGFWRA